MGSLLRGMWVEVIGNLTLAMPKRKNKVRNMVMVLWLIVILVAILQLQPPATVMNRSTGSDSITVAPPSSNRSPGDVGALPADAVSGSDLQGAPVPSDVISNLLQ